MLDCDWSSDVCSSDLVTLAVSLGHTKTLIELPSSMTHSSYGKPGGMAVRLSIGLESPTDIVDDLKNAMAVVTKTSSKNGSKRNGSTKAVKPPKPAKT
jgi:hypothetical protein